MGNAPNSALACLLLPPVLLAGAESLVSSHRVWGNASGFKANG